MKTYEDFHIECIEKHGFYAPMPPDIDLFRDLEFSKEYFKNIQSLKNKVEDMFTKQVDVERSPHGLSEEVVDTLALREVGDIYREMYQQNMEKVFFCHHTTNRVQIVRSFPTTAEKDSSWLWHYDDNAPSQYKMFIYLTDVSDECAPFTYLANMKNKPIKVRTSKVSPTQEGKKEYHRSRLPEAELDKLLSEGASEKRITGFSGECFVFDPNIVHKATKPSEEKYRIALIYHMHPVSRKQEMSNYINKSVKHFPYK